MCKPILGQDSISENEKTFPQSAGAFRKTKKLSRNLQERFGKSKTFPQSAGAFRKIEKPSCKLQERFGKPKNLPARTGELNSPSISFPQLAGAFRKMKKPPSTSPPHNFTHNKAWLNLQETTYSLKVFQQINEWTFLLNYFWWGNSSYSIIQ